MPPYVVRQFEVCGIMGHRSWLSLLLVACLAVHVGAFIVKRGDTRSDNAILKVQKKVPGLNSTNIIHSQPTAKPLTTTTTDEPQINTSEDTPRTTEPIPSCVLPPGMADEIKGYKPVVDRIIDYVTTDFQGQVYRHLAELVDTFGSRMTGTGELEAAIDWMIKKSLAENLDNVHTEDVQAPHWVRNSEYAWMTLPRIQKLNIMSLGSSVATPDDGITAEVIVVKSFEDMKKQEDKVPGRIVVFNPPWKSYGVTVQYRVKAASETAKLGGVAALVRSITPFSIQSPHTGHQHYSVEKKVPVACITVEDAAMMERIQARGQVIKVKLVLSAQNYPDVTSRNTVVEVLGTQFPNETVLVSGHLDSWDVGRGAMDDGGGVMISWGALVVMKKLGLKPRRTVRAVFWTGEEQGLYGGIEYFRRHKDDHKQFQLIMESDKGTFTPQGIEFSGTPEATCIMQEVLKLLDRINTTQITSGVEGGPDIMIWQRLGVPLGGLNNNNDHYYWYHHSHGDTLTVEDPYMLDRCLALWTSVAYVIADIQERLPHAPIP